MDRFELFSRLGESHGQTSMWVRPDGSKFSGYVHSIEREDGSGYLFNVKVYNVDEPGKLEVLFVRCLRPGR